MVAEGWRFTLVRFGPWSLDALDRIVGYRITVAEIFDRAMRERPVDAGSVGPV